MIKTITLVREDATETTLDTKPKEICLETKDGKLHLKLLWNALDLADDAEEYLAVKAVWPGKQSVRLTSGTDEELFKGKVSGFVQTKEDLGFHATQDSMLPGGLQVDVTEDTADATRMSVLITVDNFGEGGVSLDFGDGTPGGTNIGDGTTTTGHLFTAPGTYTVTATDVDQPDRTNTFEVTVPFTVGLGDLEVTIVADSSTTHTHRWSQWFAPSARLGPGRQQGRGRGVDLVGRRPAGRHQPG